MNSTKGKVYMLKWLSASSVNALLCVKYSNWQIQINTPIDELISLTTGKPFSNCKYNNCVQSIMKIPPMFGCQ